MIKFAYTILYVQDVTTAVAFYEKAFGFTRKFISPGNDYGELWWEKPPCRLPQTPWRTRT